MFLPSLPSFFRACGFFSMNDFCTATHSEATAKGQRLSARRAKRIGIERRATYQAFEVIAGFVQHAEGFVGDLSVLIRQLQREKEGSTSTEDFSRVTEGPTYPFDKKVDGPHAEVRHSGTEQRAHVLGGQRSYHLSPIVHVM
jgi:hypothetical protein